MAATITPTTHLRAIVAVLHAPAYANHMAPAAFVGVIQAVSKLENITRVDVMRIFAARMLRSA
jgi:hypothetical protein